MRFLRKNTDVIITVGPFYDKTDGVTIETALTITNERITMTADTDDNSAPTNILDNVTGATSGTANDLNYITGNDAGMMQMELSAANTNRVGRMLLSVTDAANHVPVFHEFFVLPQAIYDWLTGVIVPLPANVTTWLGTAAATPTVAGVPEVDLTHVAGATTNVSTLATSVQTIVVVTAAVIADAVLDEDMTAHQTQGSLGQAIGDPVADTNTIYKAVVTDAAGATVGVDVIAVKAETASIQSDTNDIQTRIPAALSGDGFIKADLKSVDDELTNGNNATLNLKKLNVVNNSGDALVAKSTGGGGIGFLAEGDSDNFAEGFKARGYLGIYADGTGISGGNGFLIQGNDIGLVIESSSGKSINAPQDIAVSDGDLTLTNIAKKVLTLDWTTVTGEAARSVLNALRKLRNRVSYTSPTLSIKKEDDLTDA